MAHTQPIISDRYPYLRVHIRIRAWEREAYALLDTGFTGNLVVPVNELTQAIGLPDSRTGWTLADGSMVASSIYVGSVQISELPAIGGIGITFLGDECIMGRGLIDRYRITFDHGERLIVNL